MPSLERRRRVVLPRLLRERVEGGEARRATASRGVGRHPDPVPTLPVEIVVRDHCERGGDEVWVRLQLVRRALVAAAVAAARADRQFDEPLRCVGDRRVADPHVGVVAPHARRGDDHPALGADVDAGSDRRRRVANLAVLRILEVAMRRSRRAQPRQRVWERTVLLFERADRCLAVDAVSLLGVGFDDPDSALAAGDDRDVRRGPARVVAPDLRRVPRHPPRAAAAELRALERLLLAARRGEGEPT